MHDGQKVCERVNLRVTGGVKRVTGPLAVAMPPPPPNPMAWPDVVVAADAASRLWLEWTGGRRDVTAKSGSSSSDSDSSFLQQ